MNVILSLLVTIFVSNAKETRVAVIDGGFDPFITSKLNVCDKEMPKIFGKITEHGIQHGTNVAGLIQKYAGKKHKYCFILITGLTSQRSLNQALQYALDKKADIINISGGGYKPNKKENKLVLKLLDNKVIIFAATGNNSIDLNKDCYFYPACYDKRIKAVTNSEHYANKLNRAIISNKDGSGDTVFNIELYGTSQSTAIETGRFLLNN